MQRLKVSLLGSLVLVSLLALVAAGCGGDNKSSTSGGGGTTTTSSAAITPPSNIASAGKIVYCSDITYPPEESYKAGTTTPEGSDIDIATDVAKRMGVKAQFDNTGFDGIIAALLAKKCDLVISGMNDTPERRKQVGFVDYLKVGQSFMVKKGNPENITGVPSLSGKSASVETGTTNKDYLEAQNTKLKAQGKATIKIVPFPKDTDAANALKTGKVDAYFGDAPVVVYYITKEPSSFQIGGTPINPISIGIAVNKSDTELKSAVRKAIALMYADGTMQKIVTKWKLGSAVALLKP